MSVPTQMMEKAYYLHMRRLFPKMRLLFTDTDSVMVQIFAGGRARKQHRRAAELADHGSLQQGRPVGL